MDIKCKIELLQTIKKEENENFRKAYKKNKAFIRQLKKENRSLQGQTSKLKPFSADKGLEDGLTCLPTQILVKKAALRMTFKVLPRVKKVNDQKCINQLKQYKVQKVKQEYKRLQRQTDYHEREQKQNKMKIKKVGNSLEAVKFKCKDARNAVRQYQRVKNKVEKNNLTLKCELKNLERITGTKDLDELEKVEQLLHKTLKERPEIIINYKEKLPFIDDNGESSQEDEEEEELPEIETIRTSIQQLIAEADVEDMLEPFVALIKTKQKLLMEHENNKCLLKERKKDLSKAEHQKAGMKSKGDQEIVTWVGKVNAAQEKYNTIRERRNQRLRSLSEIKITITLLLSRLDHIPLARDSAPQVPPDTQEFVLVQLSHLAQKLARLQKEFQQKNMTALEKEMEKAQLEKK